MSVEQKWGLFQQKTPRQFFDELVGYQRLHFWNQINQKAGKEATHFFDGRWWVYNTWNEWLEEDFGWWSIPTIRRTFKRLCEMGLVHKRDRENNNKGQWFALDYEALNALEAGGAMQNAEGGLRNLHRGAMQNAQATGNTETPEESSDSGSPAATRQTLTKMFPVKAQTPKTTTTLKTNLLRRSDATARVRNTSITHRRSCW